MRIVHTPLGLVGGLSDIIRGAIGPFTSLTGSVWRYTWDHYIAGITAF